MFRKAMRAASLALAITVLVVPAAHAKSLTPATLPGEHGQVVTHSTSTTQGKPNLPGGFAYGIGNAAIWTAQLARPDDRGTMLGVGNVSAYRLPAPPDERGSVQESGTVTTTSTRPDDRGYVQGIGRAVTAETFSSSSYDWTTLFAAIGVGLALVVLVAGGVVTSQRRQGGKLAV